MKPKEKAIAYFMNNIEGYDIIKNNHIIGEMAGFLEKINETKK